MPQLVRLLRAREALGVSVDTAATTAICSFGWAVYGALTDQFYFGLASGLTGFIFTLIALFSLRFGRKLKEIKVAPIWLAVLLLAWTVAGQNGLGMVLAVSVLVSNLPQLWLAYNESDLTDLSLGTWSISTIEGLTWLVYALLRQDIAVVVSTVFQVTTSGLIVALKLTRQARMQRQEG